MDQGLGTKPPWMRGASHRALPALVFQDGWVDAQPVELTALKNQILPYEEQGHWELLKKMVNPYELVYTPEDPQFHPSLALGKPLSRSYYKMIELLDTIQWIQGLPKQTFKVRTAHVAEGPGGFIQAIADVLDRHQKIFQSATAITLKPTDHRVPGWRRAASFLQRNKQVKLVYGPDGSGDIYKAENQAAFIEAATPKVHLFTADGGFDFSMNYQIQEEQVFHLLLCSAFTGIRCLATDGSLVLKVFDTFSPATKIFISLLGRNFSTWALIKPCLSRPCNSERYFVGRGFRGLTAEMVRAFNEMIEQSEKKRYPVCTESILPAEELAYFDLLSSWSIQSQTVALQRALTIAANPAQWYSDDLPGYFQTSLRWCSTYRIPTQLKVPVVISKPVVAPMSITAEAAAACLKTCPEDAAPQSQKPGDVTCHHDPSAPA